MKTTKHKTIIAWLSVMLAPLTTQALEVHEWGTFTILSSSQGIQTQWYQPYSDLAALPSFTYNFMGFSKEVTLASVRMETPVIYFYPEKEMKVTVGVSFAGGFITERFPASLPEFGNLMGVNPPQRPVAVTPSPFSLVRFPTRWSGTLLPPNHSDAKLIPVVKSQQGENYAAARNVPDAWIFRSDTPVIKTENQPDIHPVEKFIFYRGAGESTPPFMASMPDDKSMRFLNNSESASTFQVALQVIGDQAAWVKMPSIAAVDSTKEPGQQVSYATVTIPDKKISLGQADKELSALFFTELTARGLSEAEAKAMIATWNHTWFAEPGQRIFTIADRKWVDSVLPLNITPTPKKIERVFVQRYEITAPAAEKQLRELLFTKNVSDDDFSKWQAMNLGRFSQGITEIVTNQTKAAMYAKFYQLRSKLELQQAQQQEKKVSKNE